MKRRFFKKTIFFIGTLSIIIIALTTNLYAQEIKIRVIKQGAVLKLKPNEESLTIKKLPVGALLNSLESIGEWIKIKLPPDKDGIVITGYIHNSFWLSLSQANQNRKREVVHLLPG